jgi:hypothetical protein
MATATNEKQFGQTLDEAEEIAMEYVAKKFGSNDLQIITSTYTASYGIFTISLGRKTEHHHEVHASGSKEAEHQSEVRSFPCDVNVDKNGNVVACTRIVRTAREAEAIAREYAVKRHGLTHFLPYTTTFDGSNYTVYGGGIVLEEGIVRSALKIYKSKFYDVKVDKSGLIVGWTTEGLISHYSTKLQKIR